MYYSYNEYLQALLFTQAEQLDSKMIKDLIDADVASNFKAEMVKGENYYHAKHDILDRKRYYYVEGVEYEYKNKSNYKVVNPFHMKLVKQKVDYILSKPMSLNIDKPKIQDLEKPSSTEQSLIDQADEMQETIIKFLGEKYHKVMKDTVKFASNKGFDVIHFFYTQNPLEPGKPLLKYVNIPAEQCIPIFNDNGELVIMIRYYTKQLVVNDKVQQIYKVEVWDKDKVFFYEQVEQDGNFQRDQSSAYSLIEDENGNTLNYAGHWYTYSLNNPDIKQWHSWGKVPFVIFPNNSEMNNDLMPVKTLIDAYDLVDSDWVNDLADFNKLIHVLNNYMDLNPNQTQEGYNAFAQLVRNIAENQVITLDGDGKYTAEKNEVPYEAKQAFLDKCQKAIFYFGSGVDKMSEVSLGNDASGVAMEYREGELNQKAEDTITELKVSLVDFMWFICEYFNTFQGKQYDYTKIGFVFNTNKTSNESTKITMLSTALRDKAISKQTYRENLSFVPDPKEEKKRVELEDNEDFKTQQERGQDPASLAAMKQNNFNNNGNNQ